MTRLTQADSVRNLSGYPTSVVPSVPKTARALADHQKYRVASTGRTLGKGARL